MNINKNCYGCIYRDFSERQKAEAKGIDFCGTCQNHSNKQLPYLFFHSYFVDSKKWDATQLKAGIVATNSKFLHELSKTERIVLYYYIMLYKASESSTFIHNVNELVTICELNKDGRTRKAIEKAHESLSDNPINFAIDKGKTMLIESIRLFGKTTIETGDGKTIKGVVLNPLLLEKIKPNGSSMNMISFTAEPFTALDIIKDSQLAVICNIMAYALSKHWKKGKTFNLTKEIDKLFFVRCDNKFRDKQIVTIRGKLNKSFKMFGKQIKKIRNNVYEILEL